MTRQELHTNQFPDAPGVYFFLGPRKKILYIGRATSIRDRVRSYFASDIREVRSPLIEKMIGEAARIEFRKTESVLEAILLEADLIRKFKPPYNTDEKDDKSFNCVLITKEEFPRVLVVRKKDIERTRVTTPIAKIFGPFSEGKKLQIALKIIRKIFPFRDTCVPRSGKPCFNRQIGLCPGVCTGEISVPEYKTRVRDISALFSGKKAEIVQRMKRELRTATKALAFEHAGELNRTIRALQNIRDVALIGEDTKYVSTGRPFRVEAYDVSHISGTSRVGVMVVVENGGPQKAGYRKFRIRSDGGGDTGALREILTRRFSHEEWPLPDLIVVDGSIAQRRVAESVIRASILDPRFWMPVVAVTKDEYHKPKRIQGDGVLVARHEGDIILANTEAHRFSVSYHRNVRGRSMRGL